MFGILVPAVFLVRIIRSRLRGNYHAVEIRLPGTPRKYYHWARLSAASAMTTVYAANVAVLLYQAARHVAR